MTSYKDAPTRTVSAGGVDFAYRDLGPKVGVPVIFLVHLAGNLDNWDPRVVDGIAAKHRVWSLLRATSDQRSDINAVPPHWSKPTGFQRERS